MKVILSPDAEGDLVRICAYISQFNPEAADRVWNSAIRTFERLRDFPLIGRERKFNKPSLAGVRTLVVEGYRSYIIFYRHRSEHVEILRVLHGAQNLNAIFGKD